MRKTLLALVMLAAGGLAQAQVELRDNHPDRYTVVKGDTLWDISGKFLSKPWKWPELWHANPQVRNPHLIYPGDVLNLVYIDGQPRLVLNRGDRGTVKLSPGVRRTPMADSIPPIPLEAVNSWLLSNRIMDAGEDFKGAPYVLAGAAERVLSGNNDRVYVRGVLDESDNYDIFRQGRAYKDPVTGELLGYNADYVGSGRVVVRSERDQDADPETAGITTLDLTRTFQEVVAGDRVFESEERSIRSQFMPGAPATEVEGVILDVPRGITQIGRYDVVTLNLGVRDGMQEGHVLAVYKTGETVRDQVTHQMVKVPDERAGELMVFRVYDRISYALVLQSRRNLEVLDKVRNP